MNEEDKIIKGLKSAIKDFKNKDYTILEREFVPLTKRKYVINQYKKDSQYAIKLSKRGGDYLILKNKASFILTSDVLECLKQLLKRSETKKNALGNKIIMIDKGDWEEIIGEVDEE